MSDHAADRPPGPHRAHRALDGPLLVVDDFRTHFDTPGGLVQAVDGVTLQPRPGQDARHRRRVGLGQDRAGPLDHGPAHVAATSCAAARPPTTARSWWAPSNEQLRALWGTEMAMVFQDPMTSLNPVMKIGRQITEGLRYHLDMPKDEAQRAGPPAAQLGRHPRPEPPAARSTRTSCPAACASGSPSPSPWPAAPSCSSPTSPPPPSTSPCRPRSSTCSTEQQRDRHMAMVLVTHDLGVVAGRTDEIAVMYAGQIVEKAPTRTLFANVRMPYTEALLKSIPKLEEPSHTRLQIIGGPPPGPHQPARRAAASPPLPLRPAEVPRRGSRRCVEAETPGHLFRCWYPVGTEAGREALERNLAHHVPAADAAVTATAGRRLEPTRPATSRGRGDADGRHRHRPPPRRRRRAAPRRGPRRRVQTVGRHRSHAVSGISLDVREGETLGLVGESGCGKSTTGRAIMQLPPPTSGQVLLRRHRPRPRSTARSCARSAPSLQLIFQDPISSLNPRRKVKDIVAEPLRIWKRGTRRRADAPGSPRCSTPWGSTPPWPPTSAPTSSPAASASASPSPASLVLEPKVIICDEPVSALDVSVQAQILNLLEDMKARYGLTLDLHRPRPGGREERQRPRGGHVPRQDLRGRRARRPLRHPGPPLHGGAAALDPGARPHGPAGAERPPDRRAPLAASTRRPAAGSAPAARCAQERCAEEEPQVRAGRRGSLRGLPLPPTRHRVGEAPAVEVGTAVP